MRAHGIVQKARPDLQAALQILCDGLDERTCAEDCVDPATSVVATEVPWGVGLQAMTVATPTRLTPLGYHPCVA